MENVRLEIENNEKFDFIIADNVWEHLKYPYRATKNIYKLLKKNGYFLLTHGEIRNV